MSDGDLRKVFREHLRNFDWATIETGAVANGVPDMNYAAGGGIEGWIENKKADHWRTHVRPMQVGWCERRLRYNPRIFCAVRRARDELWFFHGSKMRELTEQRLDAVECLGHWTGGPGRWGWDQIAGWLARK